MGSLGPFTADEIEDMERERQALPYAAGDRDDRPWGSWAVLEVRPGCVVKRIVVQPGHRLSLQRHQHRHETWLVTAGRGLVTLGDITEVCYPGSVHQIPRGTAHRIQASDCALEFVEVQHGEILREDDIERLEDDYGRS